MFAVEVTRHAGGDVDGHFFEDATMIMKSAGEDMTFETHESAQIIAGNYTEQHENDRFAICRKTYRVVNYEDWT